MPRRTRDPTREVSATPRHSISKPRRTTTPRHSIATPRPSYSSSFFFFLFLMLIVKSVTLLFGLSMEDN